MAQGRPQISNIGGGVGQEKKGKKIWGLFPEFFFNLQLKRGGGRQDPSEPPPPPPPVHFPVA